MQQDTADLKYINNSESAVPRSTRMEMFSESYMAAFQLMRINLNDGMDEIQSYLDKKRCPDSHLVLRGHSWQE